jgi:hypothetical protein
MTSAEQKEYDQLREQLDNAQASVSEIKAYFNSALDRLTEELRLYRGLFWCMLAFALVAAILHLVQK